MACLGEPITEATGDLQLQTGLRAVLDALRRTKDGVEIARMREAVNLIGQRDLGAFFAERLDGDRDGILHFDKTGMLVPRPWLAASDIDWHLFNARFVPPGEQRSHALA